MEEIKTPIRVLMVDDEADFLSSTVPILERRGFFVSTAADGETALRLIRLRDFDIVLLDIRMPGMDGIEVFNRLRKSNPTLPVVIITGHGSIEQAFNTSRKGAEDYLTKPLNMESLAERLQRIVLKPDKNSELNKNEPTILVPSGKIRVLLVDDEPELLHSLRPLLSRRNMGVSVAGSGAEALILLQAAIIDVVVLDIRMPGMDGLETLRHIKQVFPDVEVILLTGHSSLQTALDGIKTGAAEYIMKPPDVDELVEMIRSAYLRREKKLEKQRARIVDDIRGKFPD